ncbi:TRAP transporter substrate-binding protein [Terribacillus sp. DMT04]|uniref:TRAP transporter substrate-binding protein n=1 Tax=Terribacillus sp. DMT04 TaxID=2850441 RepID=UPI001C2BB079|nr:TRAP transporter substrate-binding protein [Terribacillus sp. DMT04]QXE02015.1 TRAP transporter substrate-binding protein [Terribacillus sp. DMT04]
MKRAKTTWLILAVLLLGIGVLMIVGPSTDAAEQETKKLTMGHIHNPNSPVYASLEEFTGELEERTDGVISTDIYTEGSLGGERVMLELVQNGVVDMAKVNGGVLESFYPDFSIFSLPYVFEDEEHFKKVMQSEIVKNLYKELEEVGLHGIAYYDAGARSFYTADTPIQTPEDLHGLKIRTMTNTTSIRTMELLGASPTPLPAPEVYTGLQQGVIDGAESSPIALTDANHGEVAKFFSYDEHTRIPDFLIMSEKTWDSLTPEQQQAVEESAAISSENHNARWDQLIEESIKKAEDEMGVTFNELDQAPFKELVQPLIEERREDPKIAKVLDDIAALE